MFFDGETYLQNVEKNPWFFGWKKLTVLSKGSSASPRLRRGDLTELALTEDLRLLEFLGVVRFSRQMQQLLCGLESLKGIVEKEEKEAWILGSFVWSLLESWEIGFDTVDGRL